MTARYLGLDLSLSSPGFAVITVTDRIPTLVYATHTKTTAKLPHGQRLAQIDRQITLITDNFGPFDLIVRERGFSQHAATTQALFKVVGVSELNLRDHEIVEVPPTTVKKTLTGDGKADKTAVEIAVRRILRLPPLYRFATDDESDACAVVLAYLLAEGLIDGKT
jgi:crossover junction endodeoxyribonuclease RuvC